MIKAITYDDMIVNVRKLIISQMEIEGERVLNAASVRGPDLQKILNETDVMSPNLNDVFMTFSVIEDDNDDNYIIPEEDDTMSETASYKFAIKIYGNSSHMCAHKLRTLFKTPEVTTLLHENGIYLRGIAYPVDVKEFINNTLWSRCDIELEIQVRHNFEKVTKDGYFNQDYSKDHVEIIVRKTQ